MVVTGQCNLASVLTLPLDAGMKRLSNRRIEDQDVCMAG